MRSSGCTWPSPGRGLAESDRDHGVPAGLNDDGLVVEPDAALAEVPEVQRASGPDRHGRAPGLVRAPPERVTVRVPVVEVPHHGDGSARVVDRQCERDTNATVTAGLGCLDHLNAPLLRSANLIESIISNLCA